MPASALGKAASNGAAHAAAADAAATANPEEGALPPGERLLALSRAAGRLCAPPDLDARDRGEPNRISTTRFTLVTWLPKSLFVQFQRAANVYFLFISIIVTLDFSPIMWSSTVIPFCGVLLWTALKDMYEDFRRRRDDDAENLRRCYRYDFEQDRFVEARWRDILCGDVLLSFQDEAMPADVLLLYASGGQAYISTVNLDGETNLKERRAPNALTAITEGLLLEAAGRTSSGDEARTKELVRKLAGRVVELLMDVGLQTFLAPPKASLTDMDGTVHLATPTAEAAEAVERLKVSMPCYLNYENFVPRGCLLRNVPYTVSLAAYAGTDTKTRMNCAETQAKISNMQVYLNRGVQGLVCILILFNLYAAIWGAVEGVEDPEKWPRSWPSPIVRFLVYWIILYQIVPISLYVCFEIIKLLLGLQINRDPQMVDPKSGVAAMARTADLVEEMGQVNFVFSDKTGTLTENEMVYARCCIRGNDMGDFRPEPPAPAAASKGQPKQKEEGKQLSAGTAMVRSILANQEDPLYKEVRWYFLCMAACHTAQVEPAADAKNPPVFSGSSPDEVAFLEAGHLVGVTFQSRKRLAGKSGWEMQVDGPAKEGSTSFEILAEIPFSSERKRMTVVCQHEDQIYVLCKGADNVMQALCDRAFSEADQQHLTEYSKLGLRTLVFASKALDRDFFQAWRGRLALAEAKAEGRDLASAVAAAEIEHTLQLAGISAIEDKLQQGVPEAIVTIKAAGIRFWVLTGDKTETAVEIVRACRLFTEDMVLASMINCKGSDHALELLQAAKSMLEGHKGNGGLILDGTFAGAVLETEEGGAMLYELAIESRACVCCRLSPQQKRKLVELVKKYNKRGITLAIGDGANDVSMIQGAHVGIGIRGKEGNQAVQASDVAISQFRFLVPLLLCHGRRAYRRVAVFLCYVLYKHIVLAVGDMVWAHQCSRRFSGQIAYPEWVSSAFPAILTGLPVIVAIGFDQDLPDEIVPLCPELYAEGIDRIHFNPRVFVTWVLTAIWHGCVVWLVPNLWVGSDSWKAHLAPEYAPEDFWRGSLLSFVLVITFVNVRLWMYSYSPFAVQTLLVMLLSFSALFVVLFSLGYTSAGAYMQPQIAGMPGMIFSQWKYLRVLVVTPLFLLLDAVAVLGFPLLRPSPLDLARRRYRNGELKAPPKLKAMTAKVEAEADAAGGG